MAGLNARLMAAIPAWVDESGTSNATDTSVTVTPATRQLERITGLLAIVPVGTTSASLKLGNRLVIPLQNTVTLLSPISKLLARHEVRSITYAPAGIAFLWLWGEQTAETGFLDGGTA